jgi:aryl carrier-like protein
MEEMPMTVSGKLNRKALPEVDFTKIVTGTEYVAPRTEKEKKLAEALSTVLSVEKVNMQDNFFNIGGDSINAIYLVSELEDAGYVLQVADIMQSDTLAEIVEAMKSESNEDKNEFEDFEEYDATEEEQNELREIYADTMEYVSNLTPSQEGMYAQYFQNRETKTYQLQNLSKINKDVDIEILKKSVELLSVRHKVLSSAFTVLKTTGVIKQVILENRKPEFNVIEVEEAYTEEALNKVVEEATKKAFDLQKDALFRVTVIEFNDSRYMIMHAHHIILDGWCLPVLVSDLQKYYGELAVDLQGSL